MTEDEAKPYAKPIPIWIPETRTVIVCWMMLSSFLVIVLCWWKPPPADSQLLNTLIGMYVGTGFIGAINWWTGDAKGSDSTNKMQDKMVDSIRPSPPTSPTSASVPWWNRLTDAERTAIVAAANADPADTKLVAIATGPITLKPIPEDMAYLVTKGLLTQDRSTAIQGV